MPEYLAPGVYVEETSFRAKSIEGVGTSTTAFVGPTRTGPVSGGSSSWKPSPRRCSLTTDSTSRWTIMARRVEGAARCSPRDAGGRAPGAVASGPSFMVVSVPV